VAEKKTKDGIIACSEKLGFAALSVRHA